MICPKCKREASLGEMTTYKRADGKQICDFGWVSGLEWFDNDDEPTELIEEVWALVSTRTFTVNEPEPDVHDL